MYHKRHNFISINKHDSLTMKMEENEEKIELFFSPPFSLRQEIIHISSNFNFFLLLPSKVFFES